MKRKFIGLLFVISAMILVLVSANASAATVSDLTYKVSNGEVTITDCSTSASGTLTIPSQINGYPVTSIGSSAFRSCSSLTSVTIGNSVTSIGSRAFDYCYRLTSITVDASNEYYSSDEYGVLFNKNKTNLIQYPAGNTRTNYKIPDSVTSIGSYAFYDCDGLTSVTIPDSVTSIGSYAFYYCSGLTSVTIPDSVTSIGDMAFSYCSGLTSIEIPDSVTSIGDNMISYCSGLMSITVDTNNNYYSSDEYGVLFNKNKTELIQYPVGNTIISYKIPDSVTSIGSAAFYECRGLTSVEMPDSVTSIGDDAFLLCSGLASVEIPDSVTSIGSNAFYRCSRLTSVTIPDSVTSIGSYAFYECSSLMCIIVDANNNYYSSDVYGVLFNKNKTELIQYPIGNTRKSYKIPGSVTSIGEDAFSYCSGLTSVTIPDSVTSIGEDAFYDCDGLTRVEIPNSVTSIGYGAFYNCGGLTSVEIPNSVTSIGSSAFRGCSGLTSVEIPDSVTSLGNMAFSWCGGLTSVTIGNGIERIPASCFYYCSELKKVTIGKHVSTIDTNAFKYCSALETVVIPKSVIEIEVGAFSGCNRIKTVEYAGSDGEWQEIYIGSDNGTLASATVKYGVVLPVVISYNTNGGTGSFANQKAEEGGSTTISSVTPKKDGYKFLGWSLTSDAKLAEYQSGDILTVGEENITLYAVWKKLAVLLYNTNGGTGTFTSQKAEKGGSITISSVTPKREGYKFLGWATFFDAKSAEYKPGDVLMVGEDNITLYAIWRKIVSMETDIINNIFIITPKGMENGNPIMFVCYNNGVPVYIDVFEYEGNAIVPFTCSEEYTEVKVMALDSLENLTPLCEAEDIATGQEISLLQLN